MSGRKSKTNSDQLESRVLAVDEDYDSVIKAYLTALRINSLDDTDKELELLETLYDAMYLQYEYVIKFNNRFDREQILCKAICEDILPRIEGIMKTLEEDKDELIITRWWNIYEKYYALAARNSFRHYILFLEWDKPKKT